jgi:hypothetical protein
LLLVVLHRQEGVLVFTRRKATRVQVQHHVLGGVGSQSGDTHFAEARGGVVAGEEARRAAAGRIKTTECLAKLYIIYYIWFRLIDQNQNNSVLSLLMNIRTRRELARRLRLVAAGPGRTTLVRPWVMEITN